MRIRLEIAYEDPKDPNNMNKPLVRKVITLPVPRELEERVSDFNEILSTDFEDLFVEVE